MPQPIGQQHHLARGLDVVGLLGPMMACAALCPDSARHGMGHMPKLQAVVVVSVGGSAARLQRLEALVAGCAATLVRCAARA